MSSIKYKNVGHISRQHGISLHQLSKWNKQLDNERLKTMHQQESLKKQKKLSKISKVSFNKSILDIQEQSVELINKLEEEKAKFDKINLLIENVQQQLNKQKLEKYEDVMNKKQPDQFEELKKNLLQKQKNLQKIFLKLNSSQFEVTKKIDCIRSLRAQRGVHSNMFDKLQRQYFDVQFYYKQLLMQRTLLEKQCQNQINKFNYVHEKSSIYIPETQLQNKQKEESIIEKTKIHFDNNVIEDQCKTPGLCLSKKAINKENFKIEHLKSNRSTDKNKSRRQLNTLKNIPIEKSLEQLRKLEFKKKLQLICNDFSYQSFQQIKRKNIFKQLDQSQRNYQESNKMCQDIFKIQTQIKQLSRKLNEKKSLRQNDGANIKKVSLKTQVNQFQNEAEQIKNQIVLFKEEFSAFLSRNIKSINYDQKKLVEKFNLKQKYSGKQDLTFIQNQQILKQLMIIFNDQILEGNIEKSKGDQAIRRLIKKKSLLGLRSKKLSNISFDKKIKVRTQTQGSHLSCSSPLLKHSESQLIESILKMHSSVERGEKIEKMEGLNIMTEEDLIEESKRIIKQANKKKSQFINSPYGHRK